MTFVKWSGTGWFARRISVAHIRKFSVLAYLCWLRFFTKCSTVTHCPLPFEPITIKKKKDICIVLIRMSYCLVYFPRTARLHTLSQFLQHWCDHCFNWRESIVFFTSKFFEKIRYLFECLHHLLKIEASRQIKAYFFLWISWTCTEQLELNVHSFAKYMYYQRAIFFYFLEYAVCIEKVL